MFRSRSTAPLQVARIIFGVVLFVGVAQVVSMVHFGSLYNSGDHQATPAVFAWTWIAAIGAGTLAYGVAHLRPIHTSETLLHASLVIPAIALALILPLTIQLLWTFATGQGRGGFDNWVATCTVFTGFAHVVFALLAGLRASALARGTRPVGVGKMYILCVCAGSVPIPVLPSFFIAVTGLPILPLLYLMKPLAERERAQLEVLPLAFARNV